MLDAEGFVPPPLCVCFFSSSSFLSSGPLLTLWLCKLGEKGLVKTWKRRYFSISDNRERLQYFAQEGDAVPLGFIAFEDVHRVVLPSSREPLIDLHTDSRVWHLQAETLIQAQQVVDHVQAFCLFVVAKSLKPIDIEMRKRGEKGVIKGLKRRYFKQHLDKVYYFKSKREAMEMEKTGVAPITVLGHIDLNRVVRVRVVDSVSAYQFEVVCTQPERVYELVCDRLKEMEQMVKAFTAYSPQIFLRRLKAAAQSETTESWDAELIEHSMVLLRVKPVLLSEFIQIIFNASSVYDQERVLTVLDFLDRWFGVLSDQGETTTGTNFDMAFFCKAFEVIFDSSNFTLLMTFIGVLYHHSFFFLEERTRKMLFFDLLVDKYFEQLFLSWSLSVTNVYIQLLVFKTLRLPRSSLPGSRETFAPLDTLIHDTVVSKVEQIRAKHVQGAVGAVKLSSPYAYAENALQLWDQFMAEYVEWESNGDVLNKPLPPLRPLGPKPSIAKYGIVAKTPLTAEEMETMTEAIAPPPAVVTAAVETAPPPTPKESGAARFRHPVPSAVAPTVEEPVNVSPQSTSPRPQSAVLEKKSQQLVHDRVRSHSAEFAPPELAAITSSCSPASPAKMTTRSGSVIEMPTGPPPPIPARPGRRSEATSPKPSVSDVVSDMILKPAARPLSSPRKNTAGKLEAPPVVERESVNESLVLVETLSGDD